MNACDKQALVVKALITCGMCFLMQPIQDSSTARRADWTAGEVGSTTSRRDQCSEEGTGFCDHKGYSGELDISEGCGVQSTSLISCGDIVHVNSDLPQGETERF